MVAQCLCVSRLRNGGWPPPHKVFARRRKKTPDGRNTRNYGLTRIVLRCIRMPAPSNTYTVTSNQT
jgi:hypothetical protein